MPAEKLRLYDSGDIAKKLMSASVVQILTRIRSGVFILCAYAMHFWTL